MCKKEKGKIIIGPFDIVIHEDFAKKFNNSPSPKDADCIEDLLEEVQFKGVGENDEFFECPDGRLYVTDCNHTILFTMTRKDEAVVTDIYDAVTL